MKSQRQIDIEVSIKMLICLAVFFISWFIIHPTAYGEECQIMYVNVQEDSHLNLRSHPVNGNIEAKLSRGTPVKVVDIKDGWAKIVGAGEGGGYASINYLSYAPPADPADYVVIGNGRVHIRKEPNGKHVEWLHPGDCVSVFGMVSSGGERWAMIDEGYVMAYYLKKAEVNE